jgi:predicted transcriptional regulator
MKITQKHSSVYLGDKTKKLVEKYAEKNEISKSAVIKLAITKFFQELKP